MIEFNNIMNDGCQLPPQMDDVMIGGSPSDLKEATFEV